MTNGLFFNVKIDKTYINNRQNRFIFVDCIKGNSTKTPSMDHLRKILLTNILFIAFTFYANAQTDTEFWFCVPQLTWQHEGDTPSLLVTNTNSTTPANVTIEMPNETKFTTITKKIGASESVKIPFDAYMSGTGGAKKGTNQESNIIESGLYGESCTVKNKGIHIHSDIQVTAYLERGYTNNCDIWALKGSNAFGDYFIVPSQNHFKNHDFGGNSQDDPNAWNAIDIVAVDEAVEVTITLPQANLVQNWPNGSKLTWTVSLKKGQTLSLQAASQAADKHLGGTIIKSTGRIAVQWKDDSLHQHSGSSLGYSEGGCYDAIGDQLVSVGLAGKEYIVMRGHLGEGNNKAEYVYIMATQANTTVNFTTDDGETLDQKKLTKVGEIESVRLNTLTITGSGKDYNALYIKSDKPIIVMHMAGFGCEVGGAILPTINGCTGSLDVSVCRSTTEGFFLNIMTKKAHIGDFTVEISGKTTTLNSAWFKEIPNTGWYYLSRDHQEFSNGIDGIAIDKGDVVKVRNSTGLFHLAIINGGAGSGCRYGYFSDFSDNFGSAVITNAEDDSDYARFCEGDTITLASTGGITYFWKYMEGAAGTAPNATFLSESDRNIATPNVKPAAGFNKYEVKITRACYKGLNQDTTINVWAYGYPKIISDFDLIQPSACSPSRVAIKNNSTNANTFLWTLDDGTTKSQDTIRNFGADTLTIENFTDHKITYTLKLDASKQENCPTSKTKSFEVCPTLTAVLSATPNPAKGCQPLNVEFENTSTGPYTKMYIYFGDGENHEYSNSTTSAAPRSMKHTYYNPSIYDTTYLAILRIIDELNGGCESSDTVPIIVHGLIKAQYFIDKTSSCSPLTARFINNTIGDQNLIKYTWEVGTPITDYAGTVPPENSNAPFTLTYENKGTDAKRIYPISLTATYTAYNGDVCVSKLAGRDTLTIYPEFKVDYTVSDVSGCDPLTTTFTNNSTDKSDETQFKWYFGDGATGNSNSSIEHEYSHTLPDIQTYQTALAGENKFGCRDSIAKEIISVMPYLNPNFSIDKVSGCSPLYVTITNNTPDHASKSNTKWYINDEPYKENDPNSPYTRVSGSLDNVAVLKFENKTGLEMNITIKITDSYKDIISNQTCEKEYSNKITIYPEITAAISSDATSTICDSTLVTFKNNTTYTGVSLKPDKFSWSFGDGIDEKAETTADVKHIFKNNTGSTGTAPQTFTTTLIASSEFGCSDTATTEISVYPKIQAVFSSDNYNVCSPATVTLKNASTGADNFTYSFTDGTGNKINDDLSDVNYQITCSSAEYIETKKVTLTAKNGSCYKTTSKVFYAYPAIEPKLSVEPASGCGPLDATISNTGSTGATIYNLDFNDGLTDETGNQSIKHTFANASATDKTYTIKLTATNKLGCSASTTKDVTVYPEITAAFNYIKDTECSPIDVTLVNSSTNGTQFEWDFGDGSSQTKTNKSDFKHQYANASSDGNSLSSYTISMTAIDANHPQCHDVASKVLQVYPEVKASFTTANDEGCSPITTTFTNMSKGYSLTYSWDYAHDNEQSANASATHTHTFDNIEPSTHTYNVRLIATDINKCSDTAIMPVKAYPHITADFAYVKNDVCTPYPVTFSYPEACLNGNRFEWDFGFDSNTAVRTDKNPFDFTFNNTEPNTIKTYTIKMKSVDMNTGCYDETSQIIEVYPQLIPSFTQDVTEGCNPLTINLTNQTTGLASYLWDFGDKQSSTQTDPSHKFSHFETTDQTYNVKLKTTQIGTGCVKTFDRNFITYSYVNAKFGINDTGENSNGATSNILGGCTPFEVTITDSSRLNTTTGKWTWDFGDGNSSENRQPSTRTYTNDDNTYPLDNKAYTISLIVSNDHGCSDDTAQVIAVYPRSAPNFGGELTGCEPHTIEFSDSSIVDSKTQYFWSFSDGSTVVNRPPFSKTFHNYDYSNNKNYTATLKTTTQYNCTDEITKEIVVYPKPLANFSPLVDRACPPFNAEFKNNSEGSNLTYSWDFGNGTTQQTTSNANQKVSYSNDTEEPITFNVELITESDHGCRDTMVNPMITFPNVIVDFSFDTAGCSPHTIEIENNSTVTTTNHLWNFGDGSTSVAKEPTFTYYNTTNDDQTLTITYIGSSKYQCYDTIQKNVTVYINPNVDFVAHTPSQRYPDDTVYFENYTQDGPWTYKWDFGDGNTSNTGEKYFMYKYGRWGANENDNIFHVTLHIESEHCENTAKHDVTILPPYPKIAILNSRPAGCVPLTVDFAIAEEYCNNYEWDFEDGQTSTIAEPTHTFTEPGIYNVKLTAEGDGGSHYDYEIITVYELPEPDFTVAPSFVMLPDQPVQFFNSTKNGNTYIWDFGDGTYSTDQNPHHQYQEEGLYDVKLIAFSSQMCVDSILKPEAAEVSGAGFIKFPNAFIPSDESPSDGSYPIPDDINNVFHPVYFGVKEYDLWIFNRWGEQLFHSDDVTVGWNGRYANDSKELGQDVYFWKAKGKFENNTPFKIAGDVTLIRK